MPGPDPVDPVKTSRPGELAAAYDLREAPVPPQGTTIHIPSQGRPPGRARRPVPPPGPGSGTSAGTSAGPARRRAGAARCLAVAVVAVSAFAGALHRLAPEIRAQAPGAYLLAVLFGTALLLLQRSRPRSVESDIHDRQIDYLIGIPLLSVAVFVLTAMPARLGPRFWTSHDDLLAAPAFLAGAITLTFGTRALWRLRFPLLLSFCALLPFPRGATDSVAGHLTDSGLAVVRAAGVTVAGWTRPPGAPPGTLAAGTGGPAADVSFGGALTGAAGFLAAAALVVLLAATGAGWRGATRRGLLVAGVWGLTVTLRLGIAFAVGTAAGAGDARLVVGPTGDEVTLAVLLVALSALVLTDARPGRAARADRREPVTRAGPALALTLATGTALCWLGTR